MADRLVAFVALFGWLVGVLDASAGDIDSIYRNCVGKCEETGYIGQSLFQDCRISSQNASSNKPWYAQEELYLNWKHLSCKSDCRYYCMMIREKERGELGQSPVKYHGKWPFNRVAGLQEPVSAAVSALNLLVHLGGWLSFSYVVRKLPSRPLSNKPYYEYTGLWHIYGILAINAWFWSTIFHSWDLDLTERLDYSAAIAFLGYSLILSILRSFSIIHEASRVMISAPLLAFIATHIMYLNFYIFDYGWNMKICLVMGVAQLLLWAVWAGSVNHPSRFKLWTVVFGGAFAMLLEIFDFPPYRGYVDAHALWHTTTIPLTYIWWSFIKDDATLRTSQLISKIK